MHSFLITSLNIRTFVWFEKRYVAKCFPLEKGRPKKRDSCLELVVGSFVLWGGCSNYRSNMFPSLQAGMHRKAVLSHYFPGDLDVLSVNLGPAHGTT